jgi:hypothetical protein
MERIIVQKLGGAGVISMMDGSSGFTLLLGAGKQQGATNPCLEVRCNCIRQPIFTFQAITQQKSKWKFWSQKSNSRLCKVPSIELQMRSPRWSPEGGRQGWGDKSTLGPLHNRVACFTVPWWTCSKAWHKIVEPLHVVKIHIVSWILCIISWLGVFLLLQ